LDYIRFIFKYFGNIINLIIFYGYLFDDLNDSLQKEEFTWFTNALTSAAII